MISVIVFTCIMYLVSSRIPIYKSSCRRLHFSDLKTPQTWKHYIDYLIYNTTVHKYVDCNVCLEQCTRAVINSGFELHLSPQDSGQHAISRLTAPLSMISIQSWKLAHKKWRLTVHKDFMLNITITSAYVPFSDNCTPHNIDIYERQETFHNKRVARFCGVITMETVYVSSNDGMIQLNALTEVALFAITLEAAYQIHQRNVAYRHDRDWICVPKQINVSQPPSSMFIHQTVIQYLWYMSSKVLSTKVLYNSLKARMFIAKPTITIHRCICLTNTTSIAVYPGLLSHYRTRWHVQPKIKLKCHMIVNKTIEIDFHFYATLMLSHLHEDVLINVTIGLNGKTDALTERPVNGNTSVISSDVMPSHLLQYGHVPMDSGSMKLSNFEYSGQISTISSLLMRSLFNETSTANKHTSVSYGECCIFATVYVFPSGLLNIYRNAW